MSFCTGCGQQLPANARFCGGCGTAVGTQLTPPAQADDRTAVTSDRLNQAFRNFFSGDWAGAFRISSIGVGAMLGQAFVAALLMATGGRNVSGSELVGSIGAYTAMAAGGSLRFDSAAGSGGGLSFRPLGLTLVGFGLIAVLFVRRLRRTGPHTPAGLGLQAGRTAVALMAVLLVVALLSRSGSVSFGGAHADVASTLFFGVLTLAVALAVGALVGLPGVLPEQLTRLRQVVVGPLRGVIVLIVGACAVTLVVVVIATLVVADNLDGAGFGDLVRVELGYLILVLPNAAGAALLLGMGVPVQGSTAGSFGVSGTEDSFSILTLIDHDPRYWLWPLVALGLLAVAGMVSGRYGPYDRAGRPVGYWFGVVLPVALFVLAMSLSTGVWGFGLPVLAAGAVSFDYLLTIVFGAIAGVAAGLLGAALAPRRPAYDMAAAQ